SFSDFVTPQDPPDEWFTLAHEEEYYRGFVDNTLDPVRWRRIGSSRVRAVMTAVGWHGLPHVLWAVLLLCSRCWHAMLGSPCGFCLRDKQATRATQQLRSGKSRFNGVSWHKPTQKFQVHVWHEQKLIRLRLFLNETEAARAFDVKLRAICSDPVRLKKSLNFPTKEEASYEESLSQMRSRGLKLSSKNSAKGVESFQRLQHRFSKSPQASEFEIVNIPSLSRVDALFQFQGSKSGGLPLQLKSSVCHSIGSGEAFAFGKTKGYDDMVLVLIALDRDMIWMVPGSEVSQTTLWIRLGSARDKAWRVNNVGSALAEYLKSSSLPHISSQEALLQCCGTHLVEEHAHAQLFSAFASVGRRLHRPLGLGAAVDSVLDWQSHQWLIQEKAAHEQPDGRYCASLWKAGGCLGRLAYAKADFDMLVVSLLEVSDRLVGIFLFPSTVLAKRKLIGHKALLLRLYPPWAQPKYRAVASKHSWQLDYFADLRSWRGKGSHMDPSSKASLTELLQMAARFTQRPDHRALVCRTRLEVAGTLLTARLALETGLACNTAGGTHHAHRAWGSGYTALNDLAVTSKVLLQEGVVSRILICDLDVHQGDGTAEILREDAQAFTLSVHCKDNFPFGFKGMTHLGQDKSDLDVGLAKGTGDEVFLSTISEHLLGALDDFRPDLVLYDAGVDIHVDDDLGNLCISWDGLRKREDLVINACLSKRIPIACVIGGGYDRDPRHLAHRHAAVHRAAHDAWRLSVRLPDGSFLVGDLAVHLSRGAGPHDALQRTWATQQRCRPTPQLPWPQLRKDLSTLALSLLNFGRVDVGLHRRLHDAGERAARVGSTVAEESARYASIRECNLGLTCLLIVDVFLLADTAPDIWQQYATERACAAFRFPWREMVLGTGWKLFALLAGVQLSGRSRVGSSVPMPADVAELIAPDDPGDSIAKRADEALRWAVTRLAAATAGSASGEVEPLLKTARKVQQKLLKDFGDDATPLCARSVMGPWPLMLQCMQLGPTEHNKACYEECPKQMKLRKLNSQTQRLRTAKAH
ncbi:unnamed protein product, partial [Symbiodinium sp. KB8]